MGKVIEIGTQELTERRRKIMLGVITMVMIDEWTESGIFESNEISEAIMPVIDEALARSSEAGEDILEIEEEIDGMREKLIEFMKEDE